MLSRRDVVRELVANRRGLVCIAGLGAPAYDLAACGNNPLDFPLWGAMGGATMVGLGLALAQPARTVLVITGDGEMLMGIGSLATIAVQQPPNLRIVVLDNERYGETGQQRTHTAAGVDLAAVARACGFPSAHVARTPAELGAVRDAVHGGGGLMFAVIKVSPDDMPRVLPPRDGGYLTHRIREALLGGQIAFE